LTGIILVSHSDMAEGTKHAAEMSLGSQEFLFAVCYYVGESFEDLYNNIQSVIDQNKCENWILFTDMFGDTPSNVAALISTKNNAVVITGFSLGMLLEALVRRQNLDFKLLAESVMNSGKNGIKYIDRQMILNGINGREVKE